MTLEQRMKDLQKRAAKIEQMKLEIANKIADEYLQEVIANTPDSDTNELKNHWKTQVLKHGTGYKIIITNDLEYASQVNNGHRTTDGGYIPGKYMIDITQAEIEEKLSKYYGQMLEELFK